MHRNYSFPAGNQTWNLTPGGQYRDIVYSHARNLSKHSGTAGIQLEIPQHLRPEFKLLESHGNMIRTMIGPSVKRSIRFDNADCTLILNMRLATDKPWITVTVAQAREAKRLRSQTATAMVRSAYPNHAPPPMSSQQGRALGLPPPQPTLVNTRSRRPRPLGTPITPNQDASSSTTNPFFFFFLFLRAGSTQQLCVCILPTYYTWQL